MLVAEKEVKGIVYSLCSFNTKLLSTIGAKVSLFKWVLNQSTGIIITYFRGLSAARLLALTAPRVANSRLPQWPFIRPS